MGLRAWLGLCEHRWTIDKGLVRKFVGPAQGYAQEVTLGYIQVKECDRCGALKGFNI